MLVDYLEKEMLCIRLYGFADVDTKQKKDVKPKAKPPAINESSGFMGDNSTQESLGNIRFA
jgi:hypothetical protein